MTVRNQDTARSEIGDVGVVVIGQAGWGPG